MIAKFSKKRHLMAIAVLIGLSGCVDNATTIQKSEREKNVREDTGTETVKTLPIVSTSGPNARQFCADQGYPVSKDFDNKCNRVGTFRAFSEVFPTGRVLKAGMTRQLKIQTDLTSDETKLVKAASNLTASFPATSIVVWKDDAIIYEAYQYGTKPTDRLNSFSVGKSIVGQLVGIAIAEGKISSLSDTVAKYLPQTSGTGWEQVTIFDLVTMQSGVAYQKNVDLEILYENKTALSELLKHSKRQKKPGSEFFYNEFNTLALVEILEKVYGQPITKITSQKIWSKIGAQKDAQIVSNQQGDYLPHGFFNATARDYLRLGLIVMNEGRNHIGQQVIPEVWNSETLGRGKLKTVCPFKRGCAGKGWGYTYHSWLLPNSNSAGFMGMYGQGIIINPDTRTVIVVTGVSDQNLLRSKAGRDLVRLAD